MSSSRSWSCCRCGYSNWSQGSTRDACGSCGHGRCGNCRGSRAAPPVSGPSSAAYPAHYGLHGRTESHRRVYDLQREEAREARSRLHAWRPGGSSESRSLYGWSDRTNRREADAMQAAASNTGRTSSALGGSVLGRPLSSRRRPETGDLRTRRSASVARDPGIRGSGWWRCGNCGETNNPALTPERCVCCFQFRDAYSESITPQW